MGYGLLLVVAFQAPHGHLAGQAARVVPSWMAASTQVVGSCSLLLRPYDRSWTAINVYRDPLHSVLRDLGVICSIEME